MANFGLDINLTINHTSSHSNLDSQLACSMLRLDENRPVSTSTPITMIGKSGKAAKFASVKPFHQHTATKNPNRNKKVKDLILDLRIQQQQQQQQQMQPQLHLHHNHHNHHHHNQQAAQHFQQHVYESHSPQQFVQLNSVDADLTNMSQQTPTHTQNNNNNNNNDNYSTQYNTNYLMDTPNDNYILSNNSKLITLNRLNNQQANESQQSNNNQLELINLLNMNSNSTHSMSQQHTNYSYMLDSVSNGQQHLMDTSRRALDSSLVNLNTSNTNNNNNINSNTNNLNNNTNNSSFIGSEPHFDSLVCCNQQQLLDEASTDADNTNEEYLIYNLLNKIANSNHTDKLISSMNDESHLDKVCLYFAS